MSRTKKVLLAVFALYVIGFVSNVVLSRKPSSTTIGASPTTGATNVSEAGASPNARDGCFDRGYAVATVYFANIKQAIEVGAHSSEMMEHGCRDAAVVASVARCFEDCEAGFKAKAKEWLKNE